MENLINKELLKKAIETWGVNAQIEMIEEECIELALSIHKLRRKRGNYEEKIKNVIDEIADVRIMIEQAFEIFDKSAINDRIEFKMNRLEDRLNEKLS